MTYLQAVPDLPAEEDEDVEEIVKIETIGQAFESFRRMVVMGYVEEAALRAADWAETYADVPLPELKQR